jgi:hypothetical protein
VAIEFVLDIVVQQRLCIIQLLGNETEPLIIHAIKQVQSRFILNIAVHQSPPILQLLVIEKQQLLIRSDAFLLLNLSLDIGEGVRALHLNCDDIARRGLKKIFIMSEYHFLSPVLQVPQSAVVLRWWWYAKS